MTTTRSIVLALIALGAASGPACSCGSHPGTPGNGDGGTSGAGSTGGLGSTTNGGTNGGTSSAGTGSGGSSGGCGLRTCLSAGAKCGWIGDGCGGSLSCGSCTPPETCGGGGKPSVCGGDAGCVPKSCATANADCGPVADGCGNLLQCGVCDAGSCGAGGKPNVCGGESPDGGGSGGDAGCQPLTCTGQGFDCGPAADGCGHLLQCGSCDAGSCGAGGKPNVCSGPPGCTALTCVQASSTCGVLADGCGATIGPCGPVCTGLDVCGGGGVANQCGNSNSGVDAGCVNLCTAQTVCADGGTTSVYGVVYAPTDPTAGFGNPDPLPNALVYVANGPLQAFTPGVSCDVCGAPASGDPLVSTSSVVDGGFELDNVPANVTFPLVVQIGRWRRVVTVGPFAPCTRNELTPDQTRLPRSSAEGDIPLMAMVTGNVDVTECVLRKMGIVDAEFTAPGIPDAGRVQLWVGNGASDPQGKKAQEIDLTSTPATLAQYDQVLFACWGSENGQPASPDQPKAQIQANQQDVIDYANSGGRVFATHYSYVWLDNDPASAPLAGPLPFSATADWDLNAGSKWGSTCGTTRNPLPCPVDIDQSFPKGALLAQWLQVVGATTALGVIPQLDNPRWDIDEVVVPPSENWLQWPGNPTPLESYTPLHYTFNTPVDAGIQCGRMVFSDFHVENAKNASASTFPGECPPGPMNAQEKVLEFMLFDLASCITQGGPTPGTCSPLNCAQQGYSCGSWGDGCGNAIQCGVCDAGVCGGGGTPGVCGGIGCQPLSCQKLGYHCGLAGDGCGGQLDCGGCDAGSCGAGGVPGVCGTGVSCAPLTCQAQGLSCGPAGDGCGGLIDGGCGSCSAFEGGGDQTCGGGGQPGVCGAPPCKQLTCAGQGYNCGAAGDGCGGLLQCGLCDAGSCGGGGQANVCGTPTFR